MNLWSIFFFAQDFRIPFFVSLFALLVKTYVLVYLYKGNHAYTQRAFYLRKVLSIGLFCSLVIDFTWIMVLFEELFLINVPVLPGWALIRFSWLCGFVYSMAVALFVKYVTQKEVTLDRKYCLHFVPLLSVCCVYVVYAVTHYQNEYVSSFEYYLRLAGKLSGIFFLILPSVFYAENNIRNKIVPRILGLQARWAMLAFIVPFVVGDFLSILPIEGAAYAAFCVTYSLFLSVGILVIGRKLFRLRFLNLQKRVTSAPRATFAAEIKKISDELHTVKSTLELHYIVRAFFSNSFSLTEKNVHFYLSGSDRVVELNKFNRHDNLELFFAKEDAETVLRLKQYELLILDELLFSNFYEHDPMQEKFIALLERVNADIVLPIFKKEEVVAYIVIDRGARKNKLYSNAESDEMVVFATVLGNMITILQNASRRQLDAKYHSVQEKIHHQHQELNHYKESLRTFLRDSQQGETGILFYKNLRFSFGDRTAKEIIGINLNKYPGNPITKSLTRIASEAEKYRDARSSLIKTSDGKQLVVSAMPSLDQSSVVLKIRPPEIYDLIKKQIDLLKEPQQWDYLLYLETTRAGRLIDEALPGSSESILNFKIELLKASFCRQASLITAQLDDIRSLVTVVHQISMRDTLHVLTLHKAAPHSLDTAIKLFGANKILYSESNTQCAPPLLATLDKIGTVHIEHVEHLTLDAQKQLAEYILYGYFSPVRSKQVLVSNVRIICSTDQNLPLLVKKGTFDARLCEVLQKASVQMPSFADLDSNELKELTQDIAARTLAGNELSEFFDLTEHEKTRIINTRPASFAELQDKIQAILNRKLQNDPVFYDSDFDEIGSTNPLVARAIQLGKKALKDEGLIRALWNIFGNQAKIAVILGVNRSSVLRRCQKYGIDDSSKDISEPKIDTEESI